MIEFRPFSKIQGGFSGRHLSELKNLGWGLEDLIQLDQVHGDKIYLFDKLKDLPHLQRAAGDALVTSLKGRPIAVRTADCVPILLAHPEGIVAAVHAGWRGTLGRILQKTLQKMRKKYGLQLQQIRIAMGPAICKNCYQVGDEVANSFRKGGQGQFIQPSSKPKYLLDLKEANFFQALEEGVPSHQIEIRKECTLCEVEKFYSHRAALARGIANEGRNYSWILLEP